MNRNTVDKFEKSDKCLYCEQPMEAAYRNKKFCSDKCRVYWNRENPKANLKNFNKSEKEIKPKTDPPPKTNITINTEKTGLTAFELYQRKKLGLK